MLPKDPGNRKCITVSTSWEPVLMDCELYSPGCPCHSLVEQYGWRGLQVGIDGSTLRMDRFSPFQLSADGEVIFICRNFSSMLALCSFPRSLPRTTVLLQCPSDSKLQLPTSHAAPEATATQQCTTGPRLWLLHFVISYPLNNKRHESVDL